jgi:hypothetical protein
MLTRRATLLATLGLGAATMPAADDLTTLFTSQPDRPATPIHYRQGVIQSWDPTNLNNEVLVGRTIYTNLPVLGVGEAASYRPGITVGLAVIDSTWAIIGRFVEPGTADAQDAITQIGQRAITATVLAAETTTSTSYTDLATIGPRISNVRIPASGKASVTIGAQFVAVTAPLTAGSVGVEVSGSTSIAPSSQKSLFLIGNTAALNASKKVLFDSLPVGGLCTFTLKYLTNGSNHEFSNRDITVETL